MQPQEDITLYRFNELVAINFTDSPTMYLTAKQAKSLSDSLAVYSHDIDNLKFTESILPMSRIKA